MLRAIFRIEDQLHKESADHNNMFSNYNFITTEKSPAP